MARRKAITDEERFWSYVDKNGPMPESCPELGPCWIWTAGRFSRYPGHVNGYGQFQVNGKSMKAHRVAWESQNGPIPADKPCVLHRCDNPPCVNPRHLWTGTRKENSEDMVRKGRQARGEDHRARMRLASARGERVGGAKLTDNLVRVIRQRRNEGHRMARIARDLNVPASTVHHVCGRKTWTHLK